jgi:hypothetical protein
MKAKNYPFGTFQEFIRTISSNWKLPIENW